MSSSSTIRRTQWDSYVDALAAEQHCWLAERPTQRAGTEAVNRTTRIRDTTRDTTSRRRQAAPAPAAASPSLDYDELERLGQLHDNGTLTDEEFASAKAKILGT